MSPGPRPIVFLSDYGLDDDFVGICHAVMARISPRSNVIDLSHAVPPQDVLRGALALHRSLPFLPTDAVVLAVVDPGVGTPRLPVAVETARHGRLLVGPDNGLLTLAWLQEQGVRSAVEIASPAARLEPVSTTFHGRDIFAPAAAHLAGGMALKELGPPVDPRSLVALSLPKAGVEPGRSPRRSWRSTGSAISNSPGGWRTFTPRAWRGFSASTSLPGGVPSRCAAPRRSATSPKGPWG